MSAKKPDFHLEAVERALDAIESALRLPLDPLRLAREAGLSYWHFSRVFAALTGQSLGSYIRRRRLSAAAREVLRTRRRLVDIALDYQFGSHEAFSRAFRAMFHLSPSEFRRDPIALWSARPRLDAERLRHLARIPLKPRIVELPQLRLAGATTRFHSHLSDFANNSITLPLHWKTHRDRIQAIATHEPELSYGAWSELPAAQRQDPDEHLYLAGRSLADDQAAPPGMALWSAAPSRYARFTHRGHVSRIGDTIDYIYAAWLPRSGFERRPGFDLECYDHRFVPDSEKSSFDYLVPLVG